MNSGQPNRSKLFCLLSSAVVIGVLVCGNAQAQSSYTNRLPRPQSNQASDNIPPQYEQGRSDSTPITNATSESKPANSLTGPIRLGIEKTSTSIRLSADELKQLGQYDVDLLIDKSESMKAPDCPSLVRGGEMVSRWDWCGQQSLDLARQAAEVLTEGLNIVVFSNFPQAFNHVGAQEIPLIFATKKPGGMTNESNAVHIVLADYFARRRAEHNKVRPLLVAVITDGLPTNTFALERELIEATQQMKRPDEIHFTFLQVGQDPQGVGFIRDLDENLKKQGAKYDIVSSKTFEELVQTGLAKAMVDGISPQK